VEPDVRDELIDYVHYWSDRTRMKVEKPPGPLAVDGELDRNLSQ